MNEESIRLALAEVDKQLASALRSLAEAESGAREKGFDSTADRIRAIIADLAGDDGLTSEHEVFQDDVPGQREGRTHVGRRL